MVPGLRSSATRGVVDGVEYLLKIVGNVPGRQDAGVVWGDTYTKLLPEECGFSERVVDWRLYFKNRAGG